MAEIVLDANVIVAILYEADSQHRRARELVDRLEPSQTRNAAEVVHRILPILDRPWGLPSLCLLTNLQDMTPTLVGFFPYTQAPKVLAASGNSLARPAQTSIYTVCLANF